MVSSGYATTTRNALSVTMPMLQAAWTRRPESRTHPGGPMGESNTEFNMESATATTLTGSRDGPALADDHHLYSASISGGVTTRSPSSREHALRTAPGTRPRPHAGHHWAGFRELRDRIGNHGLGREQIAIGCEPTGGWYSRTVAAWLERHGYRITRLQNWALHGRPELAGRRKANK